MSDDNKAFFLKANKDGSSLHSHLTELVHSLLQSKDPKALEKLESISLAVKAKHFTAAEEGVKNLAPPAATTDDAWKKRSNKLFQVDVQGSAVPDVLEEMSFFEWAGLGLPREESYKLMLAMAAVRQDNPSLTKVRFFGKVLGTQSDYFVIEGTHEVGAEPAADATAPDATPTEAPGTGLNQCCYFVSNDVSAAFVQLPHVTPAQVVASGLVKKFLTGNLEAGVACYPTFPGSEKHLLRAQLGRIAAATVLAPAGKFSFGEEVEEGPDRASMPVVEVDPVDGGYEAKAPADMGKEGADNWVHKYGGILKIGRCANPPKPEPAEGEEEEDAPAEDLEEEVPALNPISSDAAVSALLEGEELPAWTTQLHFTGGRDYAVAIAKSHRWPGAYAAYANKDKCANLYIGYGYENTGSTFTPQPPPPILSEAPDAPESEDVTLAQENELLRQIDDAKLNKEEAEPEEEE